MRAALAVLMALHAMAHLPGVIVDWRLSSLPELPYRTSVLGTLGLRRGALISCFHGTILL